MALYDIAQGLRPLDLGATLGRIDQMQANRMQADAFRMQQEQEKALGATLPNVVAGLTSTDPNVRNASLLEIARAGGTRGLAVAQPFLAQAAAREDRDRQFEQSRMPLSPEQEAQQLRLALARRGPVGGGAPVNMDIRPDGNGGFVVFNPRTGQITQQPRAPTPFDLYLQGQQGGGEQPASAAPPPEAAPPQAALPAAPMQEGGEVTPASDPMTTPGPAIPPVAAPRPRTPGLPSPELFARAVDAAARGDISAQRFVQTWAPFMRQETASEPLVAVDGPNGPEYRPRSQAVGMRPAPASPATSVTLDQRGESAVMRADGETLKQVNEGAMQARSIVALLDQAENAVRRVPEGAGAQLVPILGQMGKRLGFEIEGTTEAELLRGITTTLATLQRVPGSGATTDFEMRLFMNAVPQLGNTREGNLQLIEMGRALAKRKIEEARVFRQNLGKPELQDRLDALGPVLTERQRAFLEAGVTGAATVAPAAPGAQGAATQQPGALPPGVPYVVSVQTPEEAARQPSGTYIRGPDGVIRRVP